MSKVVISHSLARKVWRKLESGLVPVVDRNEIVNSRLGLQALNEKIRRNAYIPDIVHGFLGIEKKHGVTRFLPILSKEDMAVYYQLCGELGDLVLEDLPGVFGGWQVVPTPQKLHQLSKERRREQVLAIYDSGYFGESFSRLSWFQGYQTFTALIADLLSSGKFGNYIGTTDIANFYDSIDVTRLITKLRHELPTHDDHIDLLQVFLGYWNRQTSGYQPSSKGIPQEIIADGSRNLSHFYLKNFDKRMISYANQNDVQYIRWADDLIFFASSRQRIETAIHMASRYLMADGLNLNAPKTRIFSRRRFHDYRAIDMLRAVDRNDLNTLRSQIDRRIRSNDIDFKIDTAFRAAINVFHRNKGQLSSGDSSRLNFFVRSDPNLVFALNPKQMLNFIALQPDPKISLAGIVKRACLKDVTGPKAIVLSLIRHHNAQLIGLGIDRGVLRKHVETIWASSDKSEVIRTYCAPPAFRAIARAS